jgi:hypothetical protein
MKDFRPTYQPEPLQLSQLDPDLHATDSPVIIGFSASAAAKTLMAAVSKMPNQRNQAAEEEMHKTAYRAGGSTGVVLVRRSDCSLMVCKN